MVERSSSSVGGGGGAVSSDPVASASSPISSSSSHNNSNAAAADAKADASTPPASSAAKNKRVFVFQKRWLHSLPIAEKTLADADAAGDAKKGGGDGSDAASRDVVACMLCEGDPQQQQAPQATSGTPPMQQQQQPGQHLVKMWSRTNCRRGRIENHLTSKHPEFMLLLKRKREAEGELAVQLFLQGMRDGRCSLRSEISLGLYTHTHASADAVAPEDAADVSESGGGVDAAAAELKRGFLGANVYALNRDSFSGIKAALNPPLVGAGGVLKASLELLEAESRRKRARLSGSETSDDAVTNGASDAVDLAADVTAPRDWQAALGSTEMAVFAQWQAVFVNRLVVLTGGESDVVSSLATTFWLLGTNVLLTFSSLPALKAFRVSHAARYPDADAPSSECPRGLLLSSHCAFQTRRQIDEWSCAVAAKFPRVDFLINFVDDDAASGRRPSGADDSGSEHLISSSATRLLDVCQSISALCFHAGGSGSVVNISSQADGVHRTMNWAAVETMTKALASELQPLSVQVNAILLQRIPDASGAAGSEQSGPSQRLAALEQQNAALSHTILFLLSPASAAVSGSVLRLQHRTWATNSDAVAIPDERPAAAAGPVKRAPEGRGDDLESVNEVV